MYDNLIEIRASLRERDGEEKSAWRKAFRADFVDSFDRFHEAKRTAQRTTYTPRFIDLLHGTCSCRYFVTSRFLLCSHICGPQDVDRLYFNNVRRHRAPPFWRMEHAVMEPAERGRQANSTAISIDQQRPGENTAGGRSDMTLNEVMALENGPILQEDDVISPEAAEWLQCEADWDIFFERGRALMQRQRSAGARAVAVEDMVKEVKRSINASVSVEQNVVRTWENRSDRRHYSMR
ncbi:hypothetical protein QFC22_006610 [Naganishia vaughanmartiniae]|uniref:Uncharacterized protein n=1 Tax=Naganishia vaughanmartiniae TaxID=1424756 RepID=A0ACC2WIK0_9TREE|nr:hypothetical protein QFC22_006610 [Naganishia vaughanmartiniae]